MPYIRLLTIVLIGILVSGCATPRWYSASPTGEKAKLRVAALASGNTDIVIPVAPSCPPSAFKHVVEPTDFLLGSFNRFSSESIFAEGRGFNRRVNLPGGSEYPQHLYAEHLVDAGIPILVRSTNTYSRGGPYDVGFCHSVARLILAPGREYELVFIGAGPTCEMRLFEISQETGSKVTRSPREFTDGPKNCSFGQKAIL